MGGSNVTSYYDQKQDQLIDSDNVSSAILTTDYPKIFRNNEHFIIRQYVYSDASTSTVANLSGLSLSAKIGTVGTTALISVPSTSFNIAGDWGSADLATGKICFFCNTCGTAIDTALGSLDNKQYVCNIQGNDGDGDDRTVAQYNMILVNTPD